MQLGDPLLERVGIVDQCLGQSECRIVPELFGDVVVIVHDNAATEFQRMFQPRHPMNLSRSRVSSMAHTDGPTGPRRTRS